VGITLEFLPLCPYLTLTTETVSHKNTRKHREDCRSPFVDSGSLVANRNCQTSFREEIKEEAMKDEQVRELLYQALETELGGVDVYTTALRCAENDDLKEEWDKYLEQTKNHVAIMEETLRKLGLDPDEETPGRQVVRTIGEALVEAMELALAEGEPGAAQLVAAEAVVLAETKDHQNWHLLGEVVKNATGQQAKIIQQAYEQVEEEEDEHLYHSKGWARELWIESLGMKAVLPPPEEVRDVDTAIGQAQAEQSRTAKMS
jgi:rubrerythrin